jgi:adenosylcobinamide kinase/adenosylcobinamide-phosphate guanylyltransferase
MITFITGGQRSGKSTFAEGLLRDKLNVGYIATSIVTDQEMEDRVDIHRNSRPSVWRTIEAYKDIAANIGDEDIYILECLGTMTGNIMYDHTKDLDSIDGEISKVIEEEIFSEMEQLINTIKKKKKDLIIVTNEVGFSLTSTNQVGRVYTDILGRINQRVAQLCDEAYLVVSGMEVRLK